MRIKDYLSEKFIFQLQAQPDKRAFLETLVPLIKKRITAIDDKDLLNRLLEREEQITTGIGHGVAIPHAIVDGLTEPICIVAHTPQGQDYQALDDHPVHLFFVLLGSTGKIGNHLRLLARIARLTDRDAFIGRAATAKSEKQLLEIILEEDGRHV